METYDLFMLLVLVAATLFGFWKGLAWQIASVASFVISYAAAVRLSPRLAPRFGDSEPWNRFVAMLVVFIITSFVIWTAYRLIAGFIDRVKLKEFDHQLGAVLGLAKGALWCVAITFFAVTLLPPTQKETILASRAGRYIVIALNEAHAVVPPEVHEVIHPYLNKVQERLDPNFQPEHRDLRSVWPNSQPQNGAANTSDRREENWRFPQPPRPDDAEPFTAEQPGRFSY